MRIALLVPAKISIVGSLTHYYRYITMNLIRIITLATILTIGLLNLVHATQLVFQFGNSRPIVNQINNHIQVNSPLAYSEQLSYGFEFESNNNALFEQHAFIATQPVYFSVLLPEGNYAVELVFGSEQQASSNTIKVESRRVQINQLALAKGKSTRQQFLVNVRRPQIDAQQAIVIKPREQGYLNWDNKLTLEFAAKTAVQTISISKVSDVTTVFLAGDSTVTDQEEAPWASWGQMLPQYLDDTVVIANYAESGESLTSFKQSKRWTKILSLLQQGDYIFIQFAHNDEKLKGAGIGPWLSYTDLLNEFVQASRAKGGIPVLVTPVQRRFFNADGSLKPTHGEFPDAMRAVASKLQVPLIDLTKMTTTLYEVWGDEPSRKAFVQYPANTFPNQTKKLADNTHFNTFGANEIALCVLQGISDVGLALQQAIKPKVLPYNPAKPNSYQLWTLPMSERFAAVKPDGS